MQLDSVDQILDFAIKNEDEAVKFYGDLASKAKNPAVSRALENFAKEEEGHKTKLISIKNGKQLESAKRKVLDLKIGDYLVDEEPGSELDYQGLLILAMKKEKAAFKLYCDLAASTDDENLRETLLELANEEAKHKLRFEVEYDDNIYQEN